MIEIPLSQGKVAIIDDADKDLVCQHHWYAVKNGNGRYPCACIRVSGGKRKRIFMHRLIIGAIPDDMVIDHIDGNECNNRRNNLRICSIRENICNSRIHKNNTSGFKGVCWHARAKKWSASITVNRKKIHLGLFVEKEEAHAAYVRYAKKYFGEFARLV